VHLRSLDLGEEGCEARVARIAGGGNLPTRRARTTEEEQDCNADRNSSHDLTSAHKARPSLELHGRVALEGSKVRANASKHKAMSYGRMRDRQTQLRNEVTELPALAEAADAADDCAVATPARN
jgi:hypothetical protein